MLFPTEIVVLWWFFIRLTDSQHNLTFYHVLLGIGLYESRPFSRISKCPLPFSLQLKITPLFPHPGQCCYGWFKEPFLVSEEVPKIKTSIEYRREWGGKAKYCEKLIFPKIYVEDYQLHAGTNVMNISEIPLTKCFPNGAHFIFKNAIEDFFLTR